MNAEAKAREIWEQGRSGSWFEMNGDELISLVKNALVQAEAEGYERGLRALDEAESRGYQRGVEDAAKIICSRCAEGKPLERDTHIFDGTWSICSALSVRALVRKHDTR